MMESIAERFTEAMRLRGTNPNRLAETPAEQSTIFRIANGDILAPRATTLDRFAKRLRVNLRWLLDGIGPMDSADVAQEDRATYNIKPTSGRPKRPVISLVKAGLFDDINDPFQPGEADEWEEPDYRSGPRSFWLIVDGDSMKAPDGVVPSFPDGTRVHFDPDVAATPGKFVVAKNVATQRATFKRLTSDGLTQYLQPLNSAYPTVAIDDGNIRIIAVATEWRQGGKL